jgi:hypothetical protein
VKLHADCFTTLRCVLRCALSTPSLLRLVIDASQLYKAQQLPVVDWTDRALPTNVSLRHVTLVGLSLPASSILRLCSLPLVSLDLDGCTVSAETGFSRINTQQTVGGTLKTLKLPGERDGAVGCGSLLILQLYASVVRSESPLQELVLRCPLSRQLLNLLPLHLQQLKTLDLDWCSVNLGSGPALELSPLTPQTIPAASPLPHLSQLSLPMQGILSDSVGPWQPDLEQAFTATSQQMVTAYSSQLTSLSVTVLRVSSLGAWLRLFASCHRLHTLCIARPILSRPQREAPWGELEPDSVPDELSLPGLGELTLRSLPLTDGSPLSLLRRCPELHSCWLDDLMYVTKAGKMAAFRCCPKPITDERWAEADADNNS